MNFFIQENAFEIAVCNMAAILAQSQCVNAVECMPKSISFRVL